MSYFQFVSAYRRLLAFGMLTALSSSFGQTFFISLFLPHFLADFSLDKGGFGFLYSIATLASALCLPYLGSRIDGVDLRRYTVWTIAGMAASAFLVAGSPHAVLLAVGVLGLRLTGQGLLGHISQTVMAREFLADRGKALGFAGLGYPLGEAVLPLACAVALGYLPWRWIWLAVGIGALALMLPLATRLLRTGAAVPASDSSAAATELPRGSQASFLRDPRFYQVLPTVLLPPFVLTGMFLFQMPLAESKGWRPEWLAAAFSGWAVSRALSSLAAGPLIDRFGARKLLPFYLLPLGAGLLTLDLATEAWMAFPYLMLAGITAGAMGSVSSAVWAELFGVENLGRVRSFATSLVVLSAATSPALMGVLFGQGVAIGEMVVGGIALVVLCSATALPFLLEEGERPDDRPRRRFLGRRWAFGRAGR